MKAWIATSNNVVVSMFPFLHARLTRGRKERRGCCLGFRALSPKPLNPSLGFRVSGCEGFGTWGFGLEARGLVLKAGASAQMRMYHPNPEDL